MRYSESQTHFNSTTTPIKGQKGALLTFPSATLLAVVANVTACAQEDPSYTSYSSTKPTQDSRDSNSSGSAENLLIISVDTLRADETTEAIMPNVREEANSGAEAVNHHVAGSWTFPSQMVNMTGQDFSAYPKNVFDIRKIPDDSVTLASILKAEGFATYLSSGNSIVGKETNLAIGFDTVVQVGYSTEQIENPLEWATTQNEAGKPWFVHIHIIDSHAGYNFFAESCEADSEEALAACPQWDFTQEFEQKPVNEAAATWDSATYEKCAEAARISHACEATQADESIGAILTAFEGAGLRENTVTVLYNDHGEGLGEKQNGKPVFGHPSTPQRVNQGGLLSISGPNIEPEKISMATGGIDLVPSVLQSLNLPYDEYSLPGTPVFASCRWRPFLL